jgi:beta-lactamase class A
MKLFFSFIFLLSTFSINAQKTDLHLQNEISNLLQGFNGDVGVYVYDI